MRQLTEFMFYKNTPFNDLINTIYFDSNEERDDFFNKTYQQFSFLTPFNFVKDRLTLRVPATIQGFKGTNYCRFKSDFDNITYYCFIPEYTYINDSVIEVNLMIDGIMTFCQGNELDKLEGATVKRQHLNNFYYNKYRDYIKNNDDVIKTHTKRYFEERKALFKDFTVLIQSSVLLNGNFGTRNNPEITSSIGCKFNGIPSPLDLYLMEEKDFSLNMAKLQDYPWITQNFKRIILIPKEIMNKEMANIKTEKVENAGLVNVHRIVSGEIDENIDFTKPLHFDYDELLELFEIEKDEDYLLRNEYTTIELYNFSGQELILDPGLINKDYGLKFRTLSVSGYNNEMVIYPIMYKGTNGKDGFINNSLVFKDFDDIPILIDNYNLAMAKNANQRQYRESNLLTNKIGRIMDNNNDLQDRLITSVGVLSNLSPLTLGRGLVDEHEYYRQQIAQEKDLKLEGPTITEQTTSNSMNRRYEFFGVTMLFSKPSKQEMDKIRKYYKLFGFEVEESYSNISDTRSMSLCNYLQLEGNYYIDGVERSIMETIKIRLENGIRLWHNKGIANPFKQNILENKRID